jgi:hypothetical protein
MPQQKPSRPPMADKKSILEKGSHDQHFENVRPRLLFAYFVQWRKWAVFKKGARRQLCAYALTVGVKLAPSLLSKPRCSLGVGQIWTNNFVIFSQKAHEYVCRLKCSRYILCSRYMHNYISTKKWFPFLEKLDGVSVARHAAAPCSLSLKRCGKVSIYHFLDYIHTFASTVNGSGAVSGWPDEFVKKSPNM